MNVVGVWSASEDPCALCEWCDGRITDGSLTPPAHSGCKCIVVTFTREDLAEDGLEPEDVFDVWGEGPPSSLRLASIS